MKRLAMIGLVVALAVAFVAPATFGKTIYKVGLGDPKGSDQWALGLRFKELMEASTNGEVEIQLFPGGALGNEQEMVQNCRLGTLDMAIVAINNITPFSPTVGILTLPYLIKSHYDAVKVTTGVLGQMWTQATTKEAGVSILGWCYSNFRVLTNSKRPVKTLGDLKGLKIRVPKNDIMIATYKSWGLSPVPMAWDEVFTALQQKVIDGQDNPYIVDYTMKFYEIQKYVANVHYNYALQPLVIGARAFKKLSPEMQSLMTICGKEAQQYAMLFQLAEAGNAKQGLIKGGMEIYDLEDEEKWIEAATSKV